MKQISTTMKLKILLQSGLILLLLSFTSCNFKSTGKSTPPILVLATDKDFGSYTCEILKAEGFNEFMRDSITSPGFSSGYLKKFDLVILAETGLTGSQAKILTGYVKAGGNLITFRPESKLLGIFGIRPTGTTVRDGYIRIDTTTSPGAGLIGRTLQFHGPADIFIPDGSQQLATLFFNASESCGSPAVVINRLGKGSAAAFCFNLPKSIVLTRQGNPDWAGEERDHIDGPTATDLFYPSDRDKQWNDPLKISLPQADEQMRLLTHIIEQFGQSAKPLPRFWYFPDSLKCVFMFTIDGEDTPEKEINGEIMDVQAKGANATLFEIGTYISPETVERWRAAGHEVSVHYNDVPNYSAPDYSNMSEVYERMTREFTAAYGLVPRTSRNHWAVWCSKDETGKIEFSEQARIEEKYGIQFDCNYYQFGGNNVFPNFLGEVGHFTGSGIPMRFADTQGRIINVFQSNTQLPDETWLKPNVENRGKVLIDRSIDDENYTWINANFHTWYWPECREAGLHILDHCNSRGVPVFTTERANNFVRTKDEATFTGINWKDNTLSFTVSSSHACRDRLTILLPATFGKSKLAELNLDDKKTKFSLWKIKGTVYSYVSVEPGHIHSISVKYK